MGAPSSMLMDRTIASDAAKPADQLGWTDTLPPEADAAIIGGGFSGLMTLAHVVQLAPHARVVLVERRPTRSPGVAYGACDPIHLLNVPANRMGVTGADAGAFHAWLEEHAPGAYPPDAFAPRKLYGQYLLQEVERRLSGARERVTLLRDAVVHMDRTADGLDLLMSSGRSCAARCVVLAPGIPPARAPWATFAAHVPRHLLVADPWEAGVFDGVDPSAPIVVVGSGLTAIDVVQSLRMRGHRGVITMVSRNGRLPLPHARPGQPPHQFARAELEGGPLRVMAAIRAAAKARAASGHDWQPVLDALRPHTTEIWRSWTTPQRRAFLRHARMQWEVHRHRVPRAILDELTPLMRSGSLVLAHGHLTAIDALSPSALRVEYEDIHRTRRTVDAARVYNCIGPATSVRHTADPLLRSLIGSGLAAPDAAGLGLLADRDGHVLGADGKPDPCVMLVGALRRADAWESTAVPELRQQSERAAHAVAALLGSPRSGGRA